MLSPSRDPGIFDWVLLGFLWSILLFYLYFQLHYYWKRMEGKNWPRTEAEIQAGTVGCVAGVRGASSIGAFLDYTFEVGRNRYFGSFLLLCGADERAIVLIRRLKHATLQIRYDPDDPRTSFLVDYFDLRFDGIAAIQNPDFLCQAPTPDLILKD